MTASQIQKDFGGRLIGNRKMKEHVCSVLSKMPEEIISYITKNCWFMASMEDAYAFTFTGSDLRDDHLIFLSDELLSENVNQIKYTIAHEIGHVILGHRNSVFEIQPKHEIDKQEEEADLFAKNYLL